MGSNLKIYIYRYGSICEPDIIDTFKRIGLEVYEETAEMFNKNLYPSQCVKLTSDKIINGGFSFVFSINFFPWLSDVCKIANIVYISLIVDSPVMELYSNSLSNSCNRVFLFDKELYKEFKDYFLKEKSIEEVKTAIKTHSRQYAKRQYTWFKNQMPVHWFEAQNRNEIYSAVKEWLMDEDK